MRLKEGFDSMLIRLASWRLLVLYVFFRLGTIHEITLNPASPPSCVFVDRLTWQAAPLKVRHQRHRFYSRFHSLSYIIEHMEANGRYTFTMLFEPAEEGGFVVTCPALPGLVTEGETLEEARLMAEDALRVISRACAKMVCRFHRIEFQSPSPLRLRLRHELGESFPLLRFL